MKNNPRSHNAHKSLAISFSARTYGLLILGSGMLFFAFAAIVSIGAEAESLVYQNNFEKAELDKTPDDLLVLEGAFVVKKEGDNQFLELPGAPLDTFGLMFGPALKGGTVISARFYGTGKGRRFPTFAVGANGQGSGAYRLQVSPAKQTLELYKGESVKASIPFKWESGKWTVLKLQTRKEGTGWKVEGKAWVPGSHEPDWMISADETAEPPSGKSSVWGSPYSGTPIHFDDFLVSRVGTP